MHRTRVGITGPVSGPAVMTHYWTGAVDSAGMAATRAALMAWITTVATKVNTSTHFVLEPEADLVTEADGQVFGKAAIATFDISGSDSGELLPPANQGLVTWATGVFINGHHVRGRSFIPGIGEAGSTSGVVVSSTVTAVNTACATLIADASSTLVVYSKTHGVSHPVISGTLSNKFAMLRSRRD